MPSVVDHLNAGGCIRVNHDTKQVTLVRDSLVVDIPCSRTELNVLICDRMVVIRDNDAVAVVYGRADDEVLVNQRDRNVFRALVEHWAWSKGGLPGNVSYQDLFDLCDKFSVAAPSIN